MDKAVRTLGAVALAAALVIATGPAGAAGTAARPAAPERPGATAAHGTRVTLITGDTVTVSADGKRSTIQPGKGRERLKFESFRGPGSSPGEQSRVHDHLYVIPSDAVRLVATDRLDRRLFDVTGLIKDGFARSTSTPVLVSYADGRQRPTPGVRKTRDLPAINGMAAKADQQSVTWNSLKPGGKSGVDKLWLDGKRHVVLDQSVPQIGGPDAWAAGYTGKGITVAVLDTGIDAEHPDLAGQVKASKNFTDGPAGDGFGHGTHVASIIAGTAKASDGKYKGVAFDAKLLDGKVCDNGGSCPDSAILAGMEWAAKDQKANVINLSLGGTDTPELDPLEEAVNTLTEQTGSLFVIAAGNEGPGAGTVGSPGSADAALTVGAVDKKDQIADFSSRGPRVGDGGLKPDVTAPGVDIVAAKAKGTELGEPVGEHYVTLSGTSMATPHTAGAAALLAQQHPDWKATQLKSTLMASAKPNSDLTAFDQGAGRIDLTKAIKQSVVSEPGGLSFGLQQWPHNDDTPVAKELTYRNLGDAPVDLTLKAEFSGPDGEPAPEGAVQLSAGQVTVPAGGTAKVTVTSTTKHDGPDGAYSGRVTATAGEQTVITPIGVEKEVESYDLTIKSIGSDGKPSASATTMLFGLDADVWTDLSDESGTVETRLPKGRYLVMGDVLEGTDENLRWYRLVQPTLTLDKEQTVTVDARKAKPLSVTVERKTARVGLVDLGYVRKFGESSFSGSLVSFGIEGLHSGAMGPAASPDEMTGYVSSQWGEPGKDNSFQNSPYIYGLLDTLPGAFPTGLQRAVEDKDLAKVTASYAAQVDGRKGQTSTFGTAPGVDGGWAMTFTRDLPSKVVNLLDGGEVEWQSDFGEFVPDADGFPLDQTALSRPGRSFQAGRSYSERWNQGVFTGAFPAAGFATRWENSIGISVPMYSDQAGHAGFSLVDKAASVLYRNGEKVAESDFDAYAEAEVPAGKAKYVLESTADRSKVSGLSTRTDAKWTFMSDTASADGESLPLWTVRYFPQVDDHNVTAKTPVLFVPVRVEAQPDSKVGQLRKVAVKVSSDDGKTWTDVPLVPVTGGVYLAVLTPDDNAESLSLRAAASDSLGNAVEQTISQAVALG